MVAPTETKVTAATLTAAVTGLVLYLLDTYVFGGVVPGAVEVFVTTAFTFLGGWLAPHTSRSPDPASHTPEGFEFRG